MELFGPQLASPKGPKFQLPKQVYQLLGVETDLRCTSDELRILPDRANQLDAILSQTERADLCGSGPVGEMHGKLNFTKGQLLGLFGWHYLQAFCRRQYPHHGFDRLDDGLRNATRLWRSALRSGPFRIAPPSSSAPMVVSLRDGEGSRSVAVAI